MRCHTWCWMRLTACWTWGLSPTSAPLPARRAPTGRCGRAVQDGGCAGGRLLLGGFARGSRSGRAGGRAAARKVCACVRGLPPPPQAVGGAVRGRRRLCMWRGRAEGLQWLAQRGSCLVHGGTLQAQRVQASGGRRRRAAGRRQPSPAARRLTCCCWVVTRPLPQSEDCVASFICFAE